MVACKSADTFVDPLIEKLKSTTFFGRRFTRRQIAEVQQIVATFPALSRKELAQTICEHLHWHTPSGGATLVFARPGPATLNVPG